MKATVKDTLPRRFGSSTPLECLQRSRLVLASLLQPGNRIGGIPIAEKIIDVDGSIVYLMEDGTFHEVGATICGATWETQRAGTDVCERIPGHPELAHRGRMAEWVD